MKSTVLTGRQLMSSLRIGAIVVRNPLVYLDTKGRIAVAPNRKERRDAACWRGVQRMKPEREALLRQIARTRYMPLDVDDDGCYEPAKPRPLTDAQLQARRVLATERLDGNATCPTRHPAKLRAAAKRARVLDAIRARAA